MSKDFVSSSPGFTRERGFAGWALDPQYLPLRAVILSYLLAAFLPVALESDELLYVVANYAAIALMALVAFAPRTGGLLSAGAYFGFFALYPDYLNPFQEPIEFAAAMLLAGLFVWTSLAMTGLLLALNEVVRWLGPESATRPGQLLFVWIYYSILAFVGVFLASRIQAHVLQREQTARAHALEVQRTRLAHAVDTHDTVSHSLATESAIIRVLASRNEDQQAASTLVELAQVNTVAQQQLRELLARIRGETPAEGEFASAVSEADLRTSVESLCASLGVSGFKLTADLGTLPRSLSTRMVAEVLYLVREMLTNMLKHASDGSGVLSLGVTGEERFEIRATNAAVDTTPTLPRSLAARSEQLGGSCEVEVNERTFAVVVRLPLSQQISPV